MFFFGFIIFPIFSYAVPFMVSDAVKIHCSDLNKLVVYGIIDTETKFKILRNDDERDGIPSLGYMQVRVPTAKYVKCGAGTEERLIHPYRNIRCGCKYLRKQLERYNGNYRDAVAAYNAGTAFICKTGRVKSGKACEIGKYTNQKYVDDVFKYSRRFFTDDTSN